MARVRLSQGRSENNPPNQRNRDRYSKFAGQDLRRPARHESRLRRETPAPEGSKREARGGELRNSHTRRKKSPTIGPRGRTGSDRGPFLPLSRANPAILRSLCNRSIVLLFLSLPPCLSARRTHSRIGHVLNPFFSSSLRLPLDSLSLSLPAAWPLCFLPPRSRMHRALGLVRLNSKRPVKRQRRVFCVVWNTCSAECAP